MEDTESSRMTRIAKGRRRRMVELGGEWD